MIRIIKTLCVMCVTLTKAMGAEDDLRDGPGTEVRRPPAPLSPHEDGELSPSTQPPSPASSTASFRRVLDDNGRDDVLEALGDEMLKEKIEEQKKILSQIRRERTTAHETASWSFKRFLPAAALSSAALVVGIALGRLSRQ
jgi:hypothetical protein